MSLTIHDRLAQFPPSGIQTKTHLGPGAGGQAEQWEVCPGSQVLLRYQVAAPITPLGAPPLCAGHMCVLCVQGRRDGRV